MAKLNNYSIVVGAKATYNELATAKFLASSIASATGYQPKVYTDDTPASPYEIVVGKTAREQSEGVVFERSPEKDYEYELRFTGGKLYLTGFGIPAEKTSRPFEAYATINDGATGTSLASYRFVEQTFGGGFLFPGDISMLCDADAESIEIDESYNFIFTTEALLAQKPELTDGAAIYAIPCLSSLKHPRSSIILKSADNTFTVYNGGDERDAERLCDILEYLNDGKNAKPHVTAWFISMPASSCSGALKAICENKALSDRLKVDKVCYKLLSENFYTVGSAASTPANAPFYRALLDAPKALGCEALELTTGDVVRSGDFELEVIWSPYDELESTPKVHFFDSSVVLKAKCGTQSILLLGNARKCASDDILASSPERLECDMMVVSRNGSGGISRHCYEYAKAKKYLYQTVSATYFGDNGEGFAASADSIARTRNIISECGVRYEDIYKDIYGILSLPLPLDTTK